MVGSKGNEALWKFVKGNGDDCLEADGEKGIGGHVMMVLALDVFFVYWKDLAFQVAALVQMRMVVGVGITLMWVVIMGRFP